MIPATFFNSIRETVPAAFTTVDHILEDIRSGLWKEEVMACRQDLSLKIKLPCFTPAGIFERRSKAGLKEYNGLQTLDIDNLDNPDSLKEKCRTIPWVFAAFISPGGKGLKVMVKTDKKADEFRKTEEQLAKAFFELTGFHRDKNCKDISRAHYVSFDPELYLNSDAELFKGSSTSPDKL